MMKNSTLLNSPLFNSTLIKWSNNRLSVKNNKKSNKNWIHPPEALQTGHIAYLVKFLGSTEVSQSKGIDVVKEAIKKLKFNQQIKKSEGTKIPKVDLTISVDGVAIQQPKSKKTLWQYPLHRISYCADDKAEKRFFSFIAKEGDREAHTCFVFVSDKLAEEITLTIGQAFDLAYRRFLETSSREIDLRRQIATLQHQLLNAQNENSSLKSRLRSLAELKDRPDLESFMRDNDISDINALLEGAPDDEGNDANSNGNLGVSDVTLHGQLPPVPPRNFEKGSSPLIDDLLSSDDDDFDPRAHERGSDPPFNGNGCPPREGDREDDFDPRAEENGYGHGSSTAQIHSSPSPPTIDGLMMPSLLPPPPPPRNASTASPFEGNDPFDFAGNSPDSVLAQFNEMKVGFSEGLSFGTADADFTLESLDPLKN